MQQDYEHKIEQLTEDQKISKLCYDVGLKIVARGQLFITFAADRTPTHNTHLCSTVCSQARNAHHALGSREQPKHDLHFIFVRLIRVFVIWCVAHVSSMVALTCLAAINASHLLHGIRLDHRKTVFGNQFSTLDSSRNHFQGVLYSTTLGATGSVPVHIGAGDSGASGDDLTKGHNSSADSCEKAVDYEFIISCGCSAEFYGWTAKTANTGTAFR